MTGIYLDHCATTPVRPEVLKEMLPFLRGGFGNPSSIHAHGRAARGAVETAREKAAALIGATPGEILFTSGGTESDNLAIRGIAEACGRGRHIVTSAIEHPAVLNTCRALERQGFRVTYVPVDPQGLVDPGRVAESLGADTVLVSIMHGNNEIGAIEPIEEIGREARSRGIAFHTDAVQTAGKIPVDVERLNVDLLALSSHKINGPQGIGALYVRRGVKICPMLTGGHQENGLRGGTENVPAIAGFGKACELAAQDIPSRMELMGSLRDLLQRKLLEACPDLRVNGHPQHRLPHILSVSIGGIPAEDIVKDLDRQGLEISAGSACTAGKVKVSHVMEALRMPPDIAQGTVRFSVGYGSSRKEIMQAAGLFAATIEKLTAMQELEGSLGGRRCI
jgi:cysteine desulfurase